MHNFSEQRNFGIEQVTSDWVLSIDADERITPDLKNAIVSSINSEEFNAYYIPTKHIIFGKWIKYGGWYPDYHIRLFKKGKAHWLGDIHERIAVDKGYVGRIKEPLLHLSYKKISEFISKTNIYTSMEADACLNYKNARLYISIVAEPVYIFIKRYFLLLGFLDGVRGFIISILLAHYFFLIEAKKNEHIWNR